MFDTYLLALALFVARVSANDVDHAATAHDLAVLADLLDRGTYFHDLNLSKKLGNQPWGAPLRP
jgi:hypothetical protein